MMKYKLLLPALAVMGIGSYVYIAGKTGSCPACATITKNLGLNSKAGKENAGDCTSCCETSESNDGKTFGTDGHAKKFTPGPAPAWKAKDLDGIIVSSSDLQGKVVLVDFWATWCGTCVEMIPKLKAVDSAYRDKGLVVVGMSIDDAPKEVQEFVKENDVQYRSLMASKEAIAGFGDPEFIPMAYLIDRKGQIVSAHEGEISLAQLKAEIEPLL